MKRIIKIFIDVKEEYNLTKKDIVNLQNIFKGDITQIAASEKLCENCVSRCAGEDYCNDCKSNENYLFAIKQD